MTVESRLRDLVTKWSIVDKAHSYYVEGKCDARILCAAELETILNDKSDGWLPIDTAPIDGTRVLLWSKKWIGISFGQNYGYRDWVWDSGSPPFLYQPTHWQPLPPEPNGKTIGVGNELGN